MSIVLVMLSNHLILCHPLLLLPSVFPSFRAFSSELALRIRWPKYWSFSISPSNEESGLIFFRIDWFDLLAAHLIWFDQTKLVCAPAPKFESINSTVLSFLYGPPLHLYMTSGKTIALTVQIFVSKWCLYFSVLCLGLYCFPFQGEGVFLFHGCSHCLQWFWNPRSVTCPFICHLVIIAGSENLSPCVRLFVTPMYCVAHQAPLSMGFPRLSSVQSLSHVRLFVTPWAAARQVSLSITNSWSLLKLISTESVMPSNHLILCPRLITSKWKSDVVQNFMLRVALFSHTFSNVCIFISVGSKSGK